MKNEDLLMLYTSGKGYREFLETNSGFYRESILTFKNNLVLPLEFIDEIRSLKEEKYFLAIGEPWCENCVINITLLEVVSEINEKINYRIIPQIDLSEFVLDSHVPIETTIPIILELSSGGEIKGLFSEKPSILRGLDDGSSVVRTAMKRKYREGGLAIETVREILNI